MSVLSKLFTFSIYLYNWNIILWYTTAHLFPNSPVTKMVNLLFQLPLHLVLFCQGIMPYRDEEELEMLSGVPYLLLFSVGY